MKQTLQQLEPIDVPLKNLLAWEGNVRTTEPDKSIHELAASIEAVGPLHSVVVEPTQRGKYPVIAGKRRLLALSLLQQQGKITATYKVPCRLLPPGTDLTEISLIENIQREPCFPWTNARASKRSSRTANPLSMSPPVSATPKKPYKSA